MTSHLGHLPRRKTQELRTPGLPGGSVHLSIHMGYMETLFNVGTGKAEFVGQSHIYFFLRQMVFSGQWILVT